MIDKKPLKLKIYQIEISLNLSIDCILSTSRANVKWITGLFESKDTQNALISFYDD